MIDWKTAPKRRIQLTKGFSMGWFDVSGATDAELNKIAKNPPGIGAEPKEHDFWFEVQMERQRRNRKL